MPPIKAVLLLTLFYLANITCVPFQLEPVSNKAGLFYNEIGTAKISTDHFTLLSFTNIGLYEKTLETINAVFIKTSTYCSHPTKNIQSSYIQCKNRIETLKGRIDRLEEKFESINHLTGHFLKELRVRRGLFNGIGSAFKFLTGNPDYSDAEFYDKAINQILHQNSEVKILMQQQVHIISNAISEYNRTAYTLKINEERLNKNIEIFDKFANNTVTTINSLNYYQTMTSHLNLLSFIVNEADDDFSVLISMILFSKQNVLHPSIITPKHLRDELLQIKLSGLTEFPFDPNNINEMYKFITITQMSVIYYNSTLVFAIKIPLVLKDIYQLFHLIPLPIQSLNRSVYSYIDPSFPYLALSGSRVYYGRMESLSGCRSVPPGVYICDEVVLHLTKERPVCETELRLYPQLPKLPKDCQVRVLKSDMEIFHQVQENRWLYILTDLTAATLNCGDSRIHDFQMQGTGILTLDIGCKCYTASTLLTATSNSSANYTTYVPSVNINTDDCCIQRQQSVAVDTMQPIQLHNVNLDDLKHVQHKLDQYNQLLQASIDQPLLGFHHPWSNYMVGTVFFIAMLVLILWCCCCPRCNPCRWLYQFIRRRLGASPCGMSICINSHNTVTRTSGDVRLSDLVSRESLTDYQQRTPFLSASRYSLPTEVTEESTNRLHRQKQKFRL